MIRAGAVNGKGARQRFLFDVGFVETAEAKEALWLLFAGECACLRVERLIREEIFQFKAGLQRKQPCSEIGREPVTAFVEEMAA